VAALLDTDRTHGRWPWAAAALAVPATALAWRERERLAGDDGWVYWLPVPALLWHQTEEWFLPGGFLPWFNREVLGSDEDEFPITRALGLGINVGVGWGGAIAAGLAGPRAPGLAGWVHAMNLGNVVVHATAAARERRRNPGLVTAAGLFAPMSAAALVRLGGEAGGRVALGVAAGAAMSAGAFAGLRRRASVRSR
jgi:Protein of unknown function with HXXEE motif